MSACFYSSCPFRKRFGLSVMPLSRVAYSSTLKKEKQVPSKFLYTSTRTGKYFLGLSPRANYTDRATAACRRSECQLLRIEGATWSALRIPTAVSIF
jgi:hypothetical protein